MGICPTLFWLRSSAPLHARLESRLSPANRMAEDPDSPRKGDLCSGIQTRIFQRRGEAQNGFTLKNPYCRAQ